MSSCPRSVNHVWPWWVSSAFGIAAVVAKPAALAVVQGRVVAARADAAARQRAGAGAVGSAADGPILARRHREGFGKAGVLGARRQKTDAEHMGFDNPADGRQQAWNVAPVDPLTALGVENGLELLHHKRDVASAAEDGADHARQGHGPGVVFQILGIDEDFKGTPTASLVDVVNCDVDRMVTAGRSEERRVGKECMYGWAVYE